MTRHWLELEVGDVAEHGDRDGKEIVVPGPARWYALRCRPQKEEAAERWLSQRGVYAFHPVTRRKVRVRGVLRQVCSRYLPGYVFARFPGDPLAYRVLGSPFLSDALRRADGQWGVLGVASLRALYGMRRVDEAAETARAKARKAARAARQLRPGGHALFTGGVFAGAPCQVVEVNSVTGAKVRLQLYGRETIVTASPDDLIGLSENAVDKA